MQGPREYDGNKDIVAQISEKILPGKIQTLGFLIARAAALCDRIGNMTSRCGVSIPDTSQPGADVKEGQDYISQLELHLTSMDKLIQDMDNYMTELEKII